MSREDKSSNIEDVVSEINKDLTLDKLALSQIEELIKNNPDLMDIATQQALCELPSDSIFTKSQLDSLGCDIDPSTELPTVPSEVDLDIPTPKDSGFKCQKSLDKANIIIKREQKEYSDLNILYNKLVEYKDNYDLLLSYFSARSREMNRLLNKFQPILEEIRRLETDIASLNDERDETRRLIAIARTAVAIPAIAILDAKLVKINLKLRKVNTELIDQKRYLRDQTDSESILKDRDIQYISTRYSEGIFISPLELKNTFNNVLDSQGASDIKASILAYSSAFNISLDFPGSLDTFISNTRTYKFNLSFVGLNYIQSEEDIYNEETGKRSTRVFNFPIKENTKLQKNNYFEPSTGITISNVPIGTQFTGALYTQYYDKLNDPIARLFTLDEKGLTKRARSVDPSLKSTGLSKKREGTSEYFIRDFDKMQSFYKDLEINIEAKKEKIKTEIVEPIFNTASENLKKLGKMDIKLLLAIGRINVDLTRESQSLQSIIEAIEQSQIDFIEKSKNLTSEITRIKKRMLEIKPTPERIKQILISVDSECFSEREDPGSPAELESKVENAKGNDPFGIKSLEETDPTLPTILDYKYWLQFSLILNQVALLPFPKNPTSLRYWPVGLFFPTPVGKLIKIPLPIIWIPLLVLPSQSGVTVIFLTINGLFISPIIFKIDSTGSKYHQLTVRGPSARFGYTQDPIKPTIKIPLSIASAKDALLNAGQNPLSKLTGDELQTYEAEKKSIQEKLNRTKSGSSRNKKLTQKLQDLEESISPKTETEKLQQSIDTKESAIDAIEKAKASIKDRMNQLGEPDFLNSLAIQQNIQTNRESLRKRIDETYKLYIPVKEKRKRLKQLRKEIASEGVSISEKKEALSKDIMSFFDKIKLPTVTIPRDSTKINPAPNSLVQLKEDSNEQLSNFKNDPTAPNNKNIKQSIKRELSSVLDTINVNNIPTEINGKIDIAKQTDLIKDKLKEITRNVSDKLKGESKLDVNQTKIDNVDLERQIENETEPIKKRNLIQELNINNAKLTNHNEAEQLKIDNSMSPSKLSETANTKFTFNAFKSLTDLLPTKIDFSPDLASLAPINSAQAILNGYIDSLDSDSLINMFGGQTQVSPNTIKDLYFNIVNENVPSNLDIPTKIDQKDIVSSSSGVLSSLAIPTVPTPFLTPFTLPKKLSIDLNLLVGPLRKLLVQEMENLIACMPVDLENNFNSLDSTDLKSELESKILNLLDSLINIIDPFYKALSILKSTKGINLTTDQLTSFVTPPFGPIDFVKFTAESLIKINSPVSADTVTFDLSSLDQAKKLIEPVVAPIMDNPVSFIITVAAASVGIADIQRQLHPVLNADDIPPWERLSSKNFLFVLFLDEFVSQAADKVGFFRTFI